MTLSKDTLAKYKIPICICVGMLFLMTVPAQASWLGEAWNSLKGAATEAWDTVVDAAGAVIDAIGDAVTWAWDTFKEFLSSIVNLEPGDISRVCKDFSQYKALHNADDGCWTCQIFEVFFDAGNSMAGKISGALAGPSAKILAGGLIGWITYHFMCYYSNIAKGEELLPHLSMLGGGLLRAAMCLTLVTNATGVFEYFVNPVLTSTAQYASAVIGYSCPMNAGGDAVGPLSGSKSSMVCMIKAIASGMAEPMAISDALRCGGWHWRTIRIGNDYIGHFNPGPDIFNPIMIGWGYALKLWYGILSFMFPLSLLDVVFRMGIILGFTPVYALAWVFPCTRSYTKIGFELFLHCCMSFLISAMLLMVIVSLIRVSWAAGMTGDFMQAMEKKDYINAFDAVWYNNGFTMIIITFAISVFGIFLVPKADKLASAFVNSSVIGQGVAFKAIRYIILFIIDMIILVITIITVGATSEIYLYKLFGHFGKVKRTAEAIEKARKKKAAIEKRIHNLRKRQQHMRNIQSQIRRAKQLGQAAANAMGQ